MKRQNTVGRQTSRFGDFWRPPVFCRGRRGGGGGRVVVCPVRRQPIASRRVGDPRSPIVPTFGRPPVAGSSQTAALAAWFALSLSPGSARSRVPAGETYQRTVFGRWRPIRLRSLDTDRIDKTGGGFCVVLFLGIMSPCGGCPWSCWAAVAPVEECMCLSLSAFLFPETRATRAALGR